MQAIFRDLDVDAIEPDAPEPGVFVKARKPVDFRAAVFLAVDFRAVFLAAAGATCAP